MGTSPLVIVAGPKLTAGSTPSRDEHSAPLQRVAGRFSVLVPRLSPNIQKNCAFCDTSTKFGTNVH